ncbi:3-beta hydroxysteroid dehydrogenase [Lysinibacillus sp. 2017]|uniref:SDR family oxidoreductase n=1 Tax=unclassified Lysinibacillus TaxID=2636778 RepID=UPI000D52965C|nr:MULTISPECIES: SDR family oxidoreductase [unclassified Lysinibacillus]AWE06491.1 3-beta hydroxysteroid dehydrogenase [Lysinibacillus sp. 2017]TGN32242.1 3-beta hydroxysteroid dehydrogenase [Lysinibacillus sp. S2017]
MGSHFFTGFPGFVATEMIQQLFKQGITKEVYAVVLLEELAGAKAAVQLIERQFEGCQIVLFEGDITLPNLDIADRELAIIQSNVEVVWHLAVLQDLSVKREHAWRVNVHGTVNVNDFVCHLPNLRRYMYFSSTFIAGKRTGKVLEMELIRPDEFHNYLEETKFESELLVDDLKLDVPTTIIRPSMIYGHSVTGSTKRFDGIYYMLKGISFFNSRRVIPKIGSKEPLHVVSIDYVVQASIALSELSDAEGETVHIMDRKQYDVLSIYLEMVKLMTGKSTFGRLPLGIAKAMLEQPTVHERLRIPPQFIDYLDYAAEFDTKDCEALLASIELPASDLMHSLPEIIYFYEENKHLQSFYR